MVIRGPLPIECYPKLSNSVHSQVNSAWSDQLSILIVYRDGSVTNWAVTNGGSKTEEPNEWMEDENL